MNQIRGTVVAVLLAVWCFPAVSSAKALPPESPPPPASVATATTAASSTGAESASLSASLAQRERQTPNLQDFKGGGVTIYIGSGVLLIVLVILLILLI